MEESVIRQRVGDLMSRARDDLAALVAIPSVADPAQVPPERCLEAAEWVRAAIAEIGFDGARLLDPPDGHPAVYGELAAPDGAPTVLLYSHYDVQPQLDEADWESPPFKLTERNGRWYGRGAADDKGNLVVHLTALRALAGEVPLGVKFICEGAEEQGTGGMEHYVREHAELLAADAVLVFDVGNFAIGVPTLTTRLRGIANVEVRVRSLAGAVHSGSFGGPAPDALMALLRILASLQDEAGNAVVDGLGGAATWDGIEYPVEQFRSDAGILGEAELIGDGPVADMLWARPAVSVLGIDCPPVVGSTPSVQPTASALVSLRVPPGLDAAEAQQALAAHLEAAAPWGVALETEAAGLGEPFRARSDGPAFTCMSDALGAAYGRDTQTQGEGGSIPLTNALAESLPDAEIILAGVQEPTCLIHAHNESVDPSEIERIAVAEALFLSRYAAL
ncbi:MAG: dipeptidase [Solirubrobacterales bacterium]